MVGYAARRVRCGLSERFSARLTPPYEKCACVGASLLAILDAEVEAVVKDKAKML